MEIILKENLWAEEMIREKDLGKKPSETLRRVGRYYLDNGCKKAELLEKLESFILQCDPTASLPKWHNALTNIVKAAVKYKAVDIDYLEIYKEELDKIETISSVPVKRLAFTLLCLSKYWNVIKESNDGWVNNKVNEIMSMANISASIRRQGAMFKELENIGFIQFSKMVDNTNVRVLFAGGERIEMHIDDFRNLGYQYLMYKGGPYIRCERCGITTKIKGGENKRRQKYCPECSLRMKIASNVNHTMRKGHDDDPEERRYSIYLHKSPNGKVFIGKTYTALNRRWKSGVGYSDNKPFYSDIQQYGWDGILHFRSSEMYSKESAQEIEAYLINKYGSCNKDTGYNRTRTFTDDYRKLDGVKIQFIQVDGSGNDLNENLKDA